MPALILSSGFFFIHFTIHISTIPDCLPAKSQQYNLLSSVCVCTVLIILTSLKRCSYQSEALFLVKYVHAFILLDTLLARNSRGNTGLASGKLVFWKTKRIISRLDGC